MINREIVYERNLTGSYMKIPAGINAGLDERLMLQRKLPGLLAVEKAYVNGNGQYWYNISGKQSLDTYCRMKDVGIEFIERMIISICNEMEILEWNLVKTNCLILDPELIFITNSNREFIFTIYPGSTGRVEKEFEQLMEFLLTKVDHKDPAAVKAAYGIYEKTLEEGYSITDIRDGITAARERELTAEKRVEAPVTEPTGYVQGISEEAIDVSSEIRKSNCEKKGKPKCKSKKSEKPDIVSLLRKKLTEWGIFDQPTKKKAEKENKKAKKREEVPEVVYPEEEIYIPREPIIRPTVCLNNYQGKPRGILLYQGNEQLNDIRIESRLMRIGQGQEVEIRIERDTISQLHAQIERAEDAYYIEDLNSTNGTFVNDEPLAYKEKRRLSNNDVIRFADVRYRFV